MRQASEGINPGGKKGQKYCHFAVYNIHGQIDCIVLEGYLSNVTIKPNDTLYCIGSVFVILLASWALGPFFIFIIPLPFLYYSSKLGYRQGLKLIGLTLLIVFVVGKFTGINHLFFIIVELSLLGLLMSEIYRKNLGFEKTILLGTGLMLIISFLILFLTAKSNNTGPLELIRHSLKSEIQNFMQASKEYGHDLDKVMINEALLIKTALVTFPSFFIMGTGFVVWLNIILSKPLFKLTKMEYPTFGPLDRWKTPDILIWGVITAGFASFFLSSDLRLVAINTLIVLGIVYAFHGLSIMIFYFNKYQLSLFARIAIYFLSINLFWVFIPSLIMAGIFDQWVDFRKIFKSTKSVDDSEDI